MYLEKCVLNAAYFFAFLAAFFVDLAALAALAGLAAGLAAAFFFVAITNIS